MQPVVLRTPRLELSAPVETDVDDIFRACQDPLIQRFTTVPSPYLRTHASDFVSLVAGWWESGSETTWALRRHGRLVGMVGIHRIDGAGFGEIGYWVAADARGEGLLSEACGAVIDWAFAPDGLQLARLEWRAVVGNVASARAARTLGFRYEGLLRGALASPRGREDAWIAGLLAEDDRIPVLWPVLD